MLVNPALNGVLLAMAVLCSGCQSISSEPQLYRTDVALALPSNSANIDADLSPGLSAGDRAIMESVLATLPLQDRANVVVNLGNRFVANRPALASRGFSFAPTADPQVWTNPLSGENVGFYLDDANAGGKVLYDSQIYSTGYAHDELSPNNYTYFSGKTSVDCTDSAVAHGESADIYTGTNFNNGGFQTDAGLYLTQYTFGMVSSTPVQPTEVQPFISVNGAAGQSLFGVMLYPECNSPVNLTYQITANLPLVTGQSGDKYEVELTVAGQLGLSPTGPFINASTTIVSGLPNLTGLGPYCPQCRTKRTNTLAVGSGQLALLKNSYNSWLIGIPGTPVGQWSNCIMGHYSANSAINEISAPQTTTSWATDMVEDSPGDGEVAPLNYPSILVSQPYGQATEAVSLQDLVQIKLAGRGRRTAR